MGEQRVAVVTGAAQGIGRRTAEVLAAEGCLLAVIDRQPVSGFEALSFVGDVSDEADVQRFAAEVEARYGRADVLVNNAGIASIAPAEETAAAQVGSSRVDLQACKLEYSIVSPK